MKSHVNPLSSSDAGSRSTDKVELPVITQVLGEAVTAPSSTNTSSTQDMIKTEVTDEASDADFTVNPPASTETVDNPDFTINSPPNADKQKLVDKTSKTKRSSNSSFSVLKTKGKLRNSPRPRTRQSCMLLPLKGNHLISYRVYNFSFYRYRFSLMSQNALLTSNGQYQQFRV